MSSGDQEQEQEQAAAETQESGTSLLDAVCDATRQTNRSEAEDLIKTLVQEANKGTVKFDKSITRTINAGIDAIDEVVSKQLSAIMHNEKFQKLFVGKGQADRRAASIRETRSV